MSGVVAERSFFDAGNQRLRMLCSALDFAAERERRLLDVFTCMLDPWGSRPIGRHPRWHSDISDDHSPFEFSLALSRGQPELRLLVEAQPSEASTRACWAAGKALSQRLEANFGASLDRFRLLEDLYTPDEKSTGFAMWHAACLSRHGEFDLKIYLNPQVRGAEQATSVVQASLNRLGLGDAISSLPTGRASGQIKYFSLDLARMERSRVKIYRVHPGASVDDIEAAVRSVSPYVPDQASEFCEQMAGHRGPFCKLPVQTCLAFVEGSPAPLEATIHFPIRSYAPDDHTALERILGYLSKEDGELYKKVIRAMSERALNAAAGLQSYVSLRMQEGHHRLTIYLSTELYSDW